MNLKTFDLEKITEDNQQEANALIAERLELAQALISECESIADKAKVGFSWDLAYGMGGWYEPKNGEVNRYGDEIGGWQSSSSSC